MELYWLGDSEFGTTDLAVGHVKNVLEVRDVAVVFFNETVNVAIAVSSQISIGSKSLCNAGSMLKIFKKLLFFRKPLNCFGL